MTYYWDEVLVSIKSLEKQVHQLRFSGQWEDAFVITLRLDTSCLLPVLLCFTILRYPSWFLLLTSCNINTHACAQTKQIDKIKVQRRTHLKTRKNTTITRKQQKLKKKNNKRSPLKKSKTQKDNIKRINKCF